MKYAWIDAQRKAYPLPAMCETLAVSMQRLPGVEARRAARIASGSPTRSCWRLIRAIHQELKGAYGSPGWCGSCARGDFPASKARVERLMRENGIRARHKRRYKATTDSKHRLAGGGSEPAGSELRPGGAESGVVGRPHLRLDRRGLALPGSGA